MTLDTTNSPFTKEQTDAINTILTTTNKEQKVWLSGYLTANSIYSETSDAGESIPKYQTAVLERKETRSVTILFGSETGNAQYLSETLASKLKEKDFPVTTSSMDAFKANKLKKVQDLIIISATHGEGEPPDNARDFHEFLHGRKAPKLNDLRFAVLSLGDESYEFFCQTGKDFDERLEALGGERVVQRLDCDIDFEDAADAWMNNILNTLTEDVEKPLSEESADAPAVTSEYTKKNPYAAEVLENINLNGRGSNKETRHIELSLEDSGLVFEPGDCVGIFPKNNTDIVEQLIRTLDWDAEHKVTVDKVAETLTVREALTSYYEITKLTKPLLEKTAELFENEALHSLIQDEKEVKTYLYGRDLIDLVADFPPVALKPEALLSILRKLPAREYSIASSYQANPDEVHLTIGALRYHSNGRNRSGVCSVQVAERIEPGEKIPIYIKKNPNFKFPFDEETPVIMIGPGTGIAPFRSYIEEREEYGIKGNTWLFFGDQHFTTDFLYQTEWQTWLDNGVLSKLDLAFSRDREEKVYVQHLIRENSKSFYEWLKKGAALYVCGDEKNMAKDVHNALIYVLETEGNFNREDAEIYLNDLKKEKRYQRDVY